MSWLKKKPKKPSEQYDLNSLYNLYEETYKSLRKGMWPRVARRIKSQGLTAEYLGVTSSGRVNFRCTSGTIPGKWWYQQIEFKDIDDVIELAKSNQFRQKDIINLMVSGDIRVNCFTEDARILMSNGLTKKISEVKVGEKVITRDSSEEEVLRVFKKDYKGVAYKVKTEGYQLPFTVTPKHKLLVLKDYRLLRENKTPRLKWVKAEDLKKGDLLLEPKIKRDSTLSLGKDLAFILGCYIADGNINLRKLKSSPKDRFSFEGKYVSGLKFTFDVDEDALVEEVCRSLKVLSSYTPRITRVEYKGRHWVNVQLNDISLAEKVAKLCGVRTENKHLPEGYLNLVEEERWRLLCGLWVCDGDVFKTGKSKFDSSKIIIHEQVCMLLSSLGMKYSCFVTGPKGQIKEYLKEGNKQIFRAQVSRVSSRSLRDHLGILCEEEVLDSDRYCQIYSYGDFLLRRVKEVLKVEIEEPVYNLEVSRNHSYVVNRVIVHNCNDPSFKYYWSYKAWTLGYGIHKETRFPQKRNPYLTGSICKHLGCVLGVLPFYINKIVADFRKKGILPRDKNSKSKTSKRKRRKKK